MIMQDIFNKYKNHKIFSNIWIILSSLILAFAINFIFIDSTDIWKNLKTNLLNSNSSNIISDIYLKKNWEEISIHLWKNINNCKSLSLSLVYNPENLEITNINSEETIITKIWDTKWLNSIIINYNNKSIWKNSKVLTFNTKKKINKTENINLINANFIDNTWETYLLTTSWITF